MKWTRWRWATAGSIWWLCLWLSPCWAQSSSPGGLPTSVRDALQAARIPADALSLVVLPVSAGPPRLSHQAQTPRNPASLMKLVTTTAALDLLSPAFVWRSPVYVEGSVKDGVLHGHLYLQGSGDPQWVVERLWLLLRRVQGLGIRQIQGDIVIDRGVFNVPPQDPGSFDGEPLRPYNATPDGLLINHKSLLLHWVPDVAHKVARVHVEPPLAGFKVSPTVPLSNAECTDYRSALKADVKPHQLVFAGSYPLACGEKTWPMAFPEPATFTARAVQGMWLHLGGQLSGSVREGSVPSGLKPVMAHESSTLAEVVRDINKFSNNVMADQLFLTLGAQLRGAGEPSASTEVVQTWWRDRLPQAEPPQLDKGSGLSRDARISPQSLAWLLQWAWSQGFMPELMASLPVTGLDGTMKRSKSSAVAHLKTGSLRDVMGIAGYVDAAQGQRFVLVAIVNHANASQARPVMDAAIDWTAGK